MANECEVATVDSLPNDMKRCFVRSVMDAEKRKVSDCKTTLGLKQDALNAVMADVLYNHVWDHGIPSDQIECNNCGVFPSFESANLSHVGIEFVRLKMLSGREMTVPCVMIYCRCGTKIAGYSDWAMAVAERLDDLLMCPSEESLKRLCSLFGMGLLEEKESEEETEEATVEV